MESDAGELAILPGVRIPRAELTYRATPGGGPGGQHVNRSATRVELWWDLGSSPSLTPEQRNRARTRLGRRVDARGWLRVVASSRRSQAANRDAATDRFVELLRDALRLRPARKATRPTKASRERRLADKRRRSERKRDRRRTERDE